MAAVEDDDQLSGGSWLLEGQMGGRLPGAAVARALVRPNLGRVPIKLLNPEPVIIPAGSHVANFEEVEHSPEVVAAAVPVESKDRDLDPAKATLLWDLVERSGERLREKEKEEFFVLLSEYSDVLASSSSDIGRTDKLKHGIDTRNASPIRQAVRRIPPQRRSEVQKLLADMRRDGVIKQSSSTWASPIVPVRKKDGTLRFCVDYCKLNEVTRKDAYSLPRIDDTFEYTCWFAMVYDPRPPEWLLAGRSSRGRSSEDSLLYDGRAF